MTADTLTPEIGAALTQIAQAVDAIDLYLSEADRPIEALVPILFALRASGLEQTAGSIELRLAALWGDRNRTREVVGGVALTYRASVPRRPIKSPKDLLKMVIEGAISVAKPGHEAQVVADKLAAVTSITTPSFEWKASLWDDVDRERWTETRPGAPARVVIPTREVLASTGKAGV